MKNLFSYLLIIFIFVHLSSCGTEDRKIYTLTTTVSGEGTITPSSGEYSEGETIILQANPAVGWEFIRWEGDWSGEVNPVNIGMSKNYNIVGIFQRLDYPFSVTVNGEGEVDQKIISSPKTTDYTFGTVLELTPAPSNGWEFVEWTGDVESIEEVIEITIDGETNVTVTFQLKVYPLNITINGEGTVDEKIVSQPKANEYSFGTTVELTPKPDTGWKFVDWSGDRSGDINPLTIIMESETVLTANFNELSLPTLATTEPTNITVTTAQSGGDVINEGGLSVTARGVVWSVNQNPTIDDNQGRTNDGEGIGSYTSDLNDLSSGTQYYVRAYATNIDGTAYGQEYSFTTFTLEDGEVFNPETGKIWMDRNLGAARVAISSTDSESYGDLYQWGRGADGHQVVSRFSGDGKTTSGTTSTLSSTDQPGHGDFIVGSTDWRTPQNDNLWQGVNGVNNPCPEGYRIPTTSEWDEEVHSWSSKDAAGAFNSPLKLPPLPGLRNRSSGTVGNIGSNGFYWSSTGSSDSRARFLYIDSGTASAESSGQPRSFGFSVRCIKN